MLQAALYRNDMASTETKLDVSVVFGAGTGRALRKLLDRSKHVVAVEGHPDSAQQLRRDHGDAITVVEAVAGRGDGEATLSLYSLPEWSSVSGLASLAQVFPGLQATGSRQIRQIDAGDLLSRHVSVDAQSVLVWVDVNGAERDVLESLYSNPAFATISELEVCCGAEPLFEDSMTSEDVRAWLERAGFDFVKTRGAGHARTIVASRSAQPRADEGAASISDLIGERDELRSDLESAQQALESRTQRIAELEEALDKTRALNETLKREREDSSKAASSHADELERFEQDAEAARSEIAELRDLLERSRADQSLAIHAQTMAQEDLRDLQQQYAELSDMNAQQEELLGRLRQRLGRASEYFASLPETGGRDDLIGEPLDVSEAAAEDQATKSGSESGS